MNDIKHIKQLYKEKRFKINSPDNIDVDSHNVQRKMRRGRSVLLCSCENSTKFTDTNLCRHKLFFLYYPLLKEWNERIDRLIEFYNTNRQVEKEDRAKQLSGFFCSDLEELR